MSVIIRADGSETIGMGHIMRCIGLAQELRQRGHHVLFLTGQNSNAVARRLAHEGFNQESVGVTAGTDADLEATTRAIQNHQADLLLVDGYAYQGPWLEEVGTETMKVMLWTDYVQSVSLPVDIILDQTPQADPVAYRQACPSGKILAGLKYCVLREEFLAKPNFRRLRTQANNLLITMGGSDPSGTTCTVLEALGKHESTINTKVIVGPANPNAQRIENLAKQLDDCEVYRSVSNMSSLIAWADIAISAAGITLWEFAYSGLPAIAISIAENQKSLAESLQDFGGGIDLGDADHLVTNSVISALGSMTQNSDALETASQKMMAQVDGQGVSRVANELESAFSEPNDLLLPPTVPKSKSEVNHREV